MPDVNELAREVQAEWDRQFNVPPTDTALDYRQARSAVETVLRALAVPEGADLSRLLVVDLSEGDTAFALSEALQWWGTSQADMAVFEGGNEKRVKWAEAAVKLRQRVRAILRG